VLVEQAAGGRQLHAVMMLLFPTSFVVLCWSCSRFCFFIMRLPAGSLQLLKSSLQTSCAVFSLKCAAAAAAAATAASFALQPCSYRLAAPGCLTLSLPTSFVALCWSYSRASLPTARRVAAWRYQGSWLNRWGLIFSDLPVVITTADGQLASAAECRIQQLRYGLPCV
jgi:hypothetical protein